jgi:capsular exopolysaccharide synthesis family protein
MTLIQRALEKAEREGRLHLWTPQAREEVRGSDIEPSVFGRDTDARLMPPTFDVTAWDTETDPASMSPLLVSAVSPESPAAEQFRLLRSRLEARVGGKLTQVIVVTSARLGEGKTTTSSNLAVSMAQDPHHRVLLIEADLRRSGIAAMFGVRTAPGLVDVLMGTATIDEALVRMPGQHLNILPAGITPGGGAQALASSMLRQVVDGLRSRFERIIVDTPPLAVADTHELVRVADGVLLVARAGITPRPALERALASLDRNKVIGLVLNDVDQVSDAYTYPVERQNPEV